METDTRALADDKGGGRTVDEVKDRYLETLSGRSESVVDSTLSEWIEQFGLESFEQIDTNHCRDYGLFLKRKTERDDVQFSASTAHTYYSYVRAFLSFAVRDGCLDTNPADTNDAGEFLPDDDGDRDRQFWSVEQRNTVLRFCDQQVDSALTPPKAPRSILLERLRLRALVAVLGLSGVRGGEVFSVPGDDRRNGLTWDRVDTEGNTLSVLGKTEGRYQDAQLPDRAASALERYKQVLDPPTAEWPVFPTNHYPSKKNALSSTVSNARLETMIQSSDIDTLLVEHEVPPPSLSTNGARSILKRLTERLASLYDCLEYDPDENLYLKPHGARRGLGHELYSKGRSELAQSALRHQSIDVTHESYSDIRAGETAKEVGDAIDDG